MKKCVNNNLLFGNEVYNEKQKYISIVNEYNMSVETKMYQRWFLILSVAVVFWICIISPNAYAQNELNTVFIDSQDEWNNVVNTANGLTISDGLVIPSRRNLFTSKTITYDTKQSFERITFAQSGKWDSEQWDDSGNLGPSSEPDAPIFISPSAGNYWYINAVQGGRDYHAWHSTDMVNWTSHGNVTGENWVTSAEYANGTFYVYYDEPNDENPHLLTFTDLGDVSTRKNHGMVLNTQSHGSDMAAFRDLDGTFHIVYEDWMAINARQHSWDSQYAGHTSSPDGINGFSAHEHPAVIDLRGNDTGTDANYIHPYSGEHTYNIYDGSLDAFGDYEMIRVGDTYYLFADYHPEGGSVRLGYWMSDSLDKHFEFGGTIRTNLHPDPTVGFAEGEFVMFIQDHDDLTSSGPWVEGVEVQVGVDEDGDELIDVWTDWVSVSESYGRIEGFAKAYSVDPADYDLSDLPEGFGFQFRFRSNNNAIIDKVTIESANIPEPTSGLFMLTAIALLACIYYAKRKRACR